MNSEARIEEMSPEGLRAAVAERFGHVATQPDARFNFPVGRAFAEAVGYPANLLDALPAAASASFTGVTALPRWTDLRAGEVVLDLGCGAGLDSLIAAQAVGPEGRVQGIDLSREMIELARRNAEDAGVANVSFRCAAVEDLPQATDSVDVAIANGVFNLAPEKERAAAEVARVLRPGGRLIAAEIVLSSDIPRSERATLDDWFR